MNLNTGFRCCNAGTLRTMVRENSMCKFRPYLPGSTLRLNMIRPPIRKDNPRALASGLSFRTGGQTMLCLSHVQSLGKNERGYLLF